RLRQEIPVPLRIDSASPRPRANLSPPLLIPRSIMKPLRRAAFTLTELLVVIAVIAILAALLFPVFARARAKARAPVCVSTLRQISMAIEQYVQDWDGGMPEFREG